MGDEEKAAATGTASDPVAVAIAHRVEQERKARKLTREELGKAADIDGRQIWRVEAPRGSVQVRTLLAIARGLKMTLSELVLGVEDLINQPPDRPKPKRRGPRPRGWSAGEVGDAGEDAGTAGTDRPPPSADDETGESARRARASGARANRQR